MSDLGTIIASILAAHPPHHFQDMLFDECAECVHRGGYATHLASKLVEELGFTEVRPDYSGQRYWMTAVQELNEKTREYEW